MLNMRTEWSIVELQTKGHGIEQEFDCLLEPVLQEGLELAEKQYFPGTLQPDG